MEWVVPAFFFTLLRLPVVMAEVGVGGMWEGDFKLVVLPALLRLPVVVVLVMLAMGVMVNVMMLV